MAPTSRGAFAIIRLSLRCRVKLADDFGDSLQFFYECGVIRKLRPREGPGGWRSSLEASSDRPRMSTCSLREHRSERCPMVAEQNPEARS